MPTYEVTDQQKAFFDDFGFLVLRGWLKDDLHWIEEEFESVFTDRGIIHDNVQARQVVPFIDQRERFCTLIDHPAVNAAASKLIGDDWNYQAGDGNFYVSDTPWHRDGKYTANTFVKIALYLDPVTRDTGCLRIIPGSHRLDLGWLPQHFNPEERFGVAPADVPAHALESEPGDMVLFNHNCFHASFGGGTRRRMFTMNLSKHATTEDELGELRWSIAAHHVYDNERMHSDLMRETATPERLRHLQQIIDNEDALVEALRVKHAQPTSA